MTSLQLICDATVRMPAHRLLLMPLQPTTSEPLQSPGTNGSIAAAPTVSSSPASAVAEQPADHLIGGAEGDVVSVHDFVRTNHFAELATPLLAARPLSVALATSSERLGVRRRGERPTAALREHRLESSLEEIEIGRARALSEGHVRLADQPSLYQPSCSVAKGSSPSAVSAGSGAGSDVQIYREAIEAAEVPRVRRSCHVALDFLKSRVLVPPVVGVLLGLCCSSIPLTYWLLCGGTLGTRLEDAADCPSNDAPLGFLTRGIASLGGAAVPLNLILLGNSLTSGPDWTALPVRCAAAIVVSKMILMPCFGLATSVLLDQVLGDDGLQWIALRDPCDEVLYLAAVAVTATPTANNLLLMTELAGGNKKAMSTCIFAQYLVAPLVLTLTLTVSIAVLRL